MKKLKIVNDSEQSDVTGALLEITTGCTTDVYFKDDVRAWINCNGAVTIIRTDDNQFLIKSLYYSELFNGNTNAPFASAAELAAWVDAYFESTVTYSKSFIEVASFAIMNAQKVGTQVYTVLADEANVDDYGLLNQPAFYTYIGGKLNKVSQRLIS